MSLIGENLDKVRKNICDACERAGRDPGGVTLIAVSKTHPAEDVAQAVEHGQRVFGENKVQEMVKKSGDLSQIINEREAAGERPDIVWHMIGHLQVNKVKYLPGKASMIHSVDNLKLAGEIEKQAAKRDLVMDILCEVNMAGEETKFGLRPAEVMEFVRAIAAYRHLRIRGLMTIAPYTPDAETNRVYFRGLRQLMNEINLEGIPGVDMDTLSMGMSGDYTVAIEEGATLVRVGTAIFGERDYT